MATTTLKEQIAKDKKQIFVLRKVSAVLALASVVLTGICLYGASSHLLSSSNYDLKIDTRDATVNDILGGIRIASTASSKNTVETATIGAADKDASQTTAEAYLKDIKDTMNRLVNQSKDNNSDNKKFTVARAFGINDFLAHGINGYRCWTSDLGDSSYGIEGSSSSRDSCSMKGFLRCLGQNASDGSGIYSLNSDYLSAVTNLESSNVSDIVHKWSYIKDHADPDSLIVNVSQESLSELKKLSCHHRPTKTWILGLVSFTLQLINLPLLVPGITGIVLICWPIQLASTVLWAAAFGYNQAIIKSATTKLQHSSEGLKIMGTLYNSGGTGAFFVTVLILQIVLLIPLLPWLFLLDFSSGLSPYDYGEYGETRQTDSPFPPSTLPLERDDNK